MTAMQATPSTWRLLLEARWHGDPRFKILCGGEVLAVDLAEPLLKRGIVWNLYGPTETTIWSMAHRVVPGDGPIPIGRPIAKRLYISTPTNSPYPRCCGSILACRISARYHIVRAYGKNSYEIGHPPLGSLYTTAI